MKEDVLLLLEASSVILGARRWAYFCLLVGRFDTGDFFICCASSSVILLSTREIFPGVFGGVAAFLATRVLAWSICGLTESSSLEPDEFEFESESELDFTILFRLTGVLAFNIGFTVVTFSTGYELNFVSIIEITHMRKIGRLTFKGPSNLGPRDLLRVIYFPSLACVIIQYSMALLNGFSRTDTFVKTCR